MSDQTTDQQSLVDAFNHAHHIGYPVRYWTDDREGDGKTSTTRTAAQILSGHTAVVWVDGEASCIALTHVEPLPDQPDGIKDNSRDLPDPARSAERVGEYIRAFGDGLCAAQDGNPLYARDLEALTRVPTKLADVQEQLANWQRRAHRIAQGNKRHVATLTALLERVSTTVDKLQQEGLATIHTEELRQAIDAPLRQADCPHLADVLAGRAKGCHDDSTCGWCAVIRSGPAPVPGSSRRAQEPDADVLEKAKPWATPCGRCDYGEPTVGCTCPPDDQWDEDCPCDGSLICRCYDDGPPWPDDVFLPRPTVTVHLPAEDVTR